MDKKILNVGEKIGNVIMIPNTKTIVCNYDIPAFKNILHKGDHISVYEPAGKIVDPNTDEQLGEFSFDKVILEVTEKADKYFVCQKVRRETNSPLSASVSALVTSKERIYYESINVNTSDNLELSLKNPEISIGDPVRYLK